MCPPSARHPCVPRIPIAECRSTFQHIFTGLPRGDRPGVAITAGEGRSRLPAGDRGARGGGAHPPHPSPPPRPPPPATARTRSPPEIPVVAASAPTRVARQVRDLPCTEGVAVGLLLEPAIGSRQPIQV